MAGAKAFAYRSVMRPPRLPRSALFATPPFAVLIATLSGLIASAALLTSFHRPRPSLHIPECYTLEYSSPIGRVAAERFPAPLIQSWHGSTGAMLSHRSLGDSGGRWTLFWRGMPWLGVPATRPAEFSFLDGTHRVRFVKRVAGSAAIDVDSLHVEGQLVDCDAAVLANAKRSLQARIAGCYRFQFAHGQSFADPGDFWDGPVKLADFSTARIQDFFHDSAYRAVVPSPRRTRGPESIVSYWRIKPGPLIEIGRTDGLVAIRANLWLYGDTLGGELEPRNTVVDENSLPHGQFVMGVRTDCAASSRAGQRGAAPRTLP